MGQAKEGGMATQYELYPQYVPIVKWQANEQRALQNTYSDVAPRVLPCIEVRDSSQHKRMLSHYDKVWKGAALVDYSDPAGNLTPTRQAELLAFLNLGTGSSIYASPVLSPYASQLSFQTIANALNGRKIALRLRLNDATQVGIYPPAIDKIMSLPGATSLVDRLIVDLRCTPTAELSTAQINTLASTIGTMKAMGFAHVHLASGAFPESLQHINSAGEVKRGDWTLWQKVAAASPGTLIGFSDYGPLTPEWTEEILTRRGGRSVIRYTLQERWRILRAPSNKVGDSIAISQLMVGVYGAEFKGKPYSYGDLLIDERSDPAVAMKDKRCGQYHITEYWSHHIAYVVKDQY